MFQEYLVLAASSQREKVIINIVMFSGVVIEEMFSKPMYDVQNY